MDAVYDPRPPHTCDRGMTAPGEICPGCAYDRKQEAPYRLAKERGRRGGRPTPAEFRDAGFPEQERFHAWVPVVVWLFATGGLSLLVALALAAVVAD